MGTSAAAIITTITTAREKPIHVESLILFIFIFMLSPASPGFSRFFCFCNVQIIYSQSEGYASCLLLVCYGKTCEEPGRAGKRFEV